MDRRKAASDAYKRVRDGGNDRGEPDRDDAEPDKGFDKTSARPESLRQPAQPSSGGRTPAADQIARLVDGSGVDRAARLLIALGSERAAEVLRQLDEREIEAIAVSIASTPRFRRSELREVLEDSTRAPGSAALRGGPGVAREMLTRAFGEEAGEAWFFRSVPQATAHHFRFLNDLDPSVLASLLKGEPPGAAALIMAHVDRGLAARTLTRLPTGRRAEIARRIARMGKLSREVVVRVEEAVREKIRRHGTQVSQGVDGPGTLAAILKHMTPGSGEVILHELREANVDLSDSIRQKLTTVELLLGLADRHLADLMRDFSDREIALFLKGKDEPLRARVLRAISERRAASVSDEFAHLGAQRREEVDQVTTEVLERLRELEEDGAILVPREGDRYI